MNEQKVLYNESIERQVIGVILANNEFYYQHSNVLVPELFYAPQCLRVFEAVESLARDGKTADISSVWYWMQEHASIENPDLPYLAECVSSVATTVTFGQNVDILGDMAVRRKCRDLSVKLMQASSDPSVSVKELHDFAAKVQDMGKDIKAQDKSMAQANDELRDMIVKARTGETPPNVIKTGFRDIDGYFAPALTELLIIAAETGMGKSIMCANMAMAMAANGTPCYYISMEMRSTHLAARINATKAGFSASKMMKHPENITVDELRALETAQRETSKLPLLFDEDLVVSPLAVKRNIREKAKRGYKVFFVDYIQQIVQNTDDGNQERIIGGLVRDFKNLAMELDILIVAVSQLNRDKLNPRPGRDRLRGSGQLGETANSIMFIWRPTASGVPNLHFSTSVDDEEHKAEIIIGKARDSEPGKSFFMGFDGRLTKFYDLDAQPEQNKMKTEYKKSNDNKYGTQQQQYTEDHSLPF